MLQYNTKNYNSKLLELMHTYRKNGTQPIPINFRDLVRDINSPDRATHLIHPYPAKLLLQIPYFFLGNTLLSNPDDSVLDPFAGSGTVLLESQLSGRPAYGADANPLASLISKVKTTPIDIDLLRVSAEVLTAKISIKNQQLDKMKPDVVNIDYWFYPHIQKQLLAIRSAINETENDDVKDFFLVCFSACVKKVSLADPRVSVPVRLREDQYEKKHPLRQKTKSHLSQLKVINVVKTFGGVLKNNILRMSKLMSNVKELPVATMISNDARKLLGDNGSSVNMANGLTGESIQLVITSPPYPGAQKYIRASSLNLGWLNMCASQELRALKDKIIGREEYRSCEVIKHWETGIKNADKVLQKINKKYPKRAMIAGNYLLEMKDSLEELKLVLKPGGYIVMVLANNIICGEVYDTVDYVEKIAETLGFCTKLKLVDHIKSHGLMTKRNKTASIITREFVLVFEKGDC